MNDILKPDDPNELFSLDDQETWATVQKAFTNFLRSRCDQPDYLEDLIQETIVRGLANVRDGKVLRRFAMPHFILIAKHVLSESYRPKNRPLIAVDETLDDKPSAQPTHAAQLEEAEVRQLNVACRQLCLADMSPKDREKLLRYIKAQDDLVFSEEEQEKITGLPQALPWETKNMSEKEKNSLAVQIYRLRERLRLCVKQCLEKKLTT